MDRYVVIGNPIAHSRSPIIHARFASQMGISLEYSRLLAPLDDFAGAASDFFASGGQGANVTVPFKEQAAKWVDALATPAQQALAVNTIFVERGRRIGTNTDGTGLVRDLQNNLGWRLEGSRVLILGAGGAARGVIGPILLHRPEKLLVANRTVDRARQLIDRFAAEPGPALLESCSLAELAAIDGSFDIVINATSAGLEDRVPDMPEGLLVGARCYDMVYGRDTAFCRRAREAGASAVADGLGMLVEQAAEAFCIWRGVLPDTGSVIAELRRSLT